MQKTDIDAAVTAIERAADDQSIYTRLNGRTVVVVANLSDEAWLQIRNIVTEETEAESFGA